MRLDRAIRAAVALLSASLVLAGHGNPHKSVAHESGKDVEVAGAIARRQKPYRIILQGPDSELSAQEKETIIDMTASCQPRQPSTVKQTLQQWRNGLTRLLNQLGEKLNQLGKMATRVKESGKNALQTCRRECTPRTGEEKVFLCYLAFSALMVIAAFSSLIMLIVVAHDDILRSHQSLDFVRAYRANTDPHALLFGGKPGTRVFRDNPYYYWKAVGPDTATIVCTKRRHGSWNRHMGDFPMHGQRPVNLLLGNNQQVKIGTMLANTDPHLYMSDADTRLSALPIPDKAQTKNRKLGGDK